MARVEIYTKMFCGYCYRAKRLLDAQGRRPMRNIDITMGGPKRAEMIQRANGRTTVPQIFIDDRHVGGCDDLHALERRRPARSAAGGRMRIALYPGADRDRSGRQCRRAGRARSTRRRPAARRCCSRRR